MVDTAAVVVDVKVFVLNRPLPISDCKIRRMIRVSPAPMPTRMLLSLDRVFNLSRLKIQE